MGIKRLTEESFLQLVTQFAQLHHWRVYHTRDSRRSAAGFPDLVMAKAGRAVVYAELKTDKGRLSPEQEAWLADLRAATGGEVYVWRPSSWAEIQEVLR